MEFKTWLESLENWFRNSQVIRDGKPLIVYHGTVSGGFKTFEPRKSLPIGSLGYWFVEDPDVAWLVATRKGSNASIMPVYLRIVNPKIIPRGLRQLVNEISPQGEVTLEKVKTYKEKLKKQGYDGIILPDETADGGRSTQYVAFEPNQIKSAIGVTEATTPLDPNYVLTNIQKVWPQYILDRIARFWVPGQKTVTIYHATRNPEDESTEIVPGDWVTFDRSYARMHQQARRSKRILKKVVPADHVSWTGTDENEFFYTPPKS